MSVHHIEPPRGSPLALAFEWVSEQRRASSSPELTAVVADAQRCFSLSAAEVEWLTWSLDPSRLTVAPKEPDAP